jgi:hypothetical protein
VPSLHCIPNDWLGTARVRLTRFRRSPGSLGDREGRIGRLCCRRSGTPLFFTVVLALPHCFFQFFLMIRKQSMDLTVRLVADCVNLRAEFLARGIRIFVEQRLNLVVVLLKQRPDLLLLFRG